MTLKDYFSTLPKAERSKLMIDLCDGLKISLYQFNRKKNYDCWTPLEREVARRILKDEGYEAIEI